MGNVVAIAAKKLWGASELADLIEALMQATDSAGALSLYEGDIPLNETEELLHALDERALTRLARHGALLDVEVCDLEHSRVIGTVTSVDFGRALGDDPRNDPSPMIDYGTDAGEQLCDMVGAVYFRVPGSAAYGERATVELLRIAAAQRRH